MQRQIDEQAKRTQDLSASLDSKISAIEGVLEAMQTQMAGSEVLLRRILTHVELAGGDPNKKQRLGHTQ